jgi:hypothetical protein
MTGKDDVVEALVKAGADVNYGNPPPVTIAASMGRERSLNLLIDRNADLSAEVSVVVSGWFFCWESVSFSLLMFHLELSSHGFGSG